MFVGAALQRLSQLDVTDVEVLRSEFDAGGYDLVMSLRKVVRHIQLKTVMVDGKTSNTKVSLKLMEKPSGCVIWIKMAGTTFRLWGIDAPESKQLCADGWPAGTIATQHMRRLVEGKAVACEERGHDRYGRIIALCRADGVDLGAEMVRAGMALAFVRYSRDYIAEEAAAKSSNLGMHGHECEAPWDWRASQKSVK